LNILIPDLNKDKIKIIDKNKEKNNESLSNTNDKNNDKKVFKSEQMRKQVSLEVFNNYFKKNTHNEGKDLKIKEIKENNEIILKDKENNLNILIKKDSPCDIEKSKDCNKENTKEEVKEIIKKEVKEKTKMEPDLNTHQPKMSQNILSFFTQKEKQRNKNIKGLEDSSNSQNILPSQNQINNINDDNNKFKSNKDNLPQYNEQNISTKETKDTTQLSTVKKQKDTNCTNPCNYKLNYLSTSKINKSRSISANLGKSTSKNSKLNAFSTEILNENNKYLKSPNLKSR